MMTVEICSLPVCVRTINFIEKDCRNVQPLGMSWRTPNYWIAFKSLSEEDTSKNDVLGLSNGGVFSFSEVI